MNTYTVELFTRTTLFHLDSTKSVVAVAMVNDTLSNNCSYIVDSSTLLVYHFYVNVKVAYLVSIVITSIMQYRENVAQLVKTLRTDRGKIME